MKRIITTILFLVLLSFSVSATDIFTEPYSDTFTPQDQLGSTLTEIKSDLNFKSCYVEDNWQSKNCEYMYFCYAILPHYSEDIGDALERECVDVSEKTNVDLNVVDFLPPKGVLYYVTNFITVTEFEADQNNEWDRTDARLPEDYFYASALRSVCPGGQMLGVERDPQGVAIGQKCYLSERVCLDTLSTGLCTNAYPLFVLDTDEDGSTDDELNIASNYCADRNKDRICDFAVDFECVDDCSEYTVQDGSLTCMDSRSNGICDEWDMAGLYSCIDSEQSPNSNICDDIDSSICQANYDPVCVGGQGGTTYPNECFAEQQGHPESDYSSGACEPPITQCYSSNDCPTPDVCIGGSTAGIESLCLDNMCAYSGACANLECSTDSDCEGLTMPCVGVEASCSSGRCAIQGKCLTQPEPVETETIWDILQSIWDAFWGIVSDIFGM